jgi:hypothetical protein
MDNGLISHEYSCVLSKNNFKYQVFDTKKYRWFLCVTKRMLYLHHWLCRNKSAVNILQLISLPLIVHLIRDRPFNLKGEGGLWFFVSLRNFFSDNTRVRIFIFLSRKARNFFLEFNIRLYDKNSELDYFFFSSTKIRIFFHQHWESEYFFIKKP